MRRDLLPLWIKIFIWIFILMAVAVIAVFILGFWDIYLPLELYGLRAELLDTPLGLFLFFLFLLKGLIGWSLWSNWSKAIDYALIDGVLGLIIASYVTIASFGTSHINFRLEIIVLLLYLYVLITRRSKWINYHKEN